MAKSRAMLRSSVLRIVSLALAHEAQGVGLINSSTGLARRDLFVFFGGSSLTPRVACLWRVGRFGPAAAQLFAVQEAPFQPTMAQISPNSALYSPLRFSMRAVAPASLLTEVGTLV